MTKINKNLIASFVVLSISVFSLMIFIPTKAEAVLVKSGATVVYNTDENSPNQKDTVSQDTNKNQTTKETKTIAEINKEKISLAANAISASDFLPSTFSQWLIVLLLVAFVIVLWRKIHVKERKNGHLKHA